MNQRELQELARGTADQISYEVFDRHGIEYRWEPEKVEALIAAALQRAQTEDGREGVQGGVRT